MVCNMWSHMHTHGVLFRGCGDPGHEGCLECPTPMSTLCVYMGAAHYVSFRDLGGGCISPSLGMVAPA